MWAGTKNQDWQESCLAILIVGSNGASGEQDPGTNVFWHSCFDSLITKYDYKTDGLLNRHLS